MEVDVKSDNMISVFTATFNRMHTLPRLYNSLLGQSHTSFEWIVIDDGSQDSTDDLIKTWLDQVNKKFSITYVKTENRGKSRAINAGILLASKKSDLFYIVDSDDFLPPDALERVNLHWNHVKDDPSCAGIAGCCIDTSGRLGCV